MQHTKLCVYKTSKSAWPLRQIITGELPTQRTCFPIKCDNTSVQCCILHVFTDGIQTWLTYMLAVALLACSPGLTFWHGLDLLAPMLTAVHIA